MAKKRKPRTRHRITLLGWVFVLVTVLLLLAAVNTGTNLLYLISGTILSLSLLSLLAMYGSFRHLYMARQAPYAVHRGECAPMTLRLENRSRWRTAFSIRLLQKNSEGEEETIGYWMRLPAQRAAEIQTQEIFPKRGIFPLPDLTLSTTFPFGLIESRSTHPFSQEITVYPRTQSIRTTVFERMPGTGQAPQMHQGDGDEFFCLREYVPGDDIRRISWRASARLGYPVVKDLEPDTSRFVVILLDTHLMDQTDQAAQQLEDAIETAASLGATLLRKQFYVAIATPESTLQIGDGKGHETAMLELLARLEGCAERPDDFAQGSGLMNLKRAAYLFITPNPALWGTRESGHRTHVLHPAELTHV